MEDKSVQRGWMIAGCSASLRGVGGPKKTGAGTRLAGAMETPPILSGGARSDRIVFRSRPQPAPSYHGSLLRWLGWEVN